MLFDLRKFFSAGLSPSEKRFTVDLSDARFSGARIPAPVSARFCAVRLSEDEIELSLDAEAQVSGECARCLDPVTRQETVHAVWPVKLRDLDDPDFELPRDAKGLLDVEEWLRQEFSLQIPPVLLCSPDCSGLCPVCGKKRQDCTCPEAAESTSADARLSILKSLLN
jgi:uncharacterized protein